ncbi:uncharacterized protein EI90DRAFT_3034707 [Cantharellus anzutake]|uniref:uncharacterized protein n=1 Tax=Cantharellus anzutake TaxID=1750568 RepID=UPI001904815A|nr:uncharacterized protein EI90DRAFT_3034707 [Cantharellus anzutake]KAF8341645.1 hypothetical protein EI90DRAFT_3034707 [Cantharellus anzutake]
MFTLHRRSARCPISSLPNELLYEIATYLPIRHSTKDFVNDNRDVAAFSMLSGRMRSVALPLLFHEISITSESQLEALSKVPEDLLGEVRALNIFMDPEFIDSWKIPSLSYALIHILSQTPALHALRVLVAELTGQSSAWSRFSLAVTALPRFIDALDDIEPLVLLAPNLEILRMNKSSGYEADANTHLVKSLANLPNIRELAYSPESLRMNEETGVQAELEGLEVEDADGSTKKDDGSVGLIHAIALAAPSLETLNLQTRWYGEDIRFPESSEPISADALKEALEVLPRLKSIALPSTVSTSVAASLSNTIALEHAIATELGSANLNLELISFIRPRTIFMGHNSTPIIRPSAEDDQVDARTKTVKGISLERVWHQLIDERQVAMTAIIAGASAFAVSGAGRFIASQ